MTDRLLVGTTAGKTGRSFSGNRELHSPVPVSARVAVRQWCNNNGIFMDENGQYIIWRDHSTGKENLVRLYLNYHEMKNGRKILTAANNRSKIRVNLAPMIFVESMLEQFDDFDEKVVKACTGRQIEHLK